MDLLATAPALAVNIFNQNWPEGIVGLLEIFGLCCLLGGIAAVMICRSRNYRIKNGIKHNSGFKEVNSNHWADDRNKDAR